MSSRTTTQERHIEISLDVRQNGVVIRATVNGQPNASYAAMPAERVPTAVQALVAEILEELRASVRVA